MMRLQIAKVLKARFVLLGKGSSLEKFKNFFLKIGKLATKTHKNPN